MRRFLAWLAGRELVWVSALALLATYGFFCEYLPPMERVHLYSDIEGYHFPIQRYAFDSLKAGRFPQWDPSIYCGVSFAANVQAALLYPPTWLMYAASWRREHLKFKMLQDFVFVHFAIAFVLGWLWLRGRRLDRFAAGMGAGVFAFGGYMASQCVHVGVASGLPWMPLGLWGIDESAERGEWRPLWKTAVASALCFLAGYPPTWIVYCCTCGLYALMGRGRWRAALGVCGALAASILLALAQWLPMLQASSSAALTDKYGDGVYHWQSLLPYVVPNWFTANRATPSDYPQDALYLYVGLPALFAIGWALARREWRPYLQPAVVSAACLVMATNPGYWISNLVLRVGILERALQTYNFFEGVAAMAALVTALGLHDFLARGGRRWFAPATGLAAAAALAWTVRQMWIWGHGGRYAAGWGSAAEMASALAIFAAGVWTMRASAGAPRALLAASLLCMVWTDFKTFGADRAFNTVDGDVDKLQIPVGIRGMNKAGYWTMWKNRQYRVASDERGGPYSTDYRMWGLATPQGFDPFLPRVYHQFIEQWVRFDNNREFRMDVRSEPMLQQLGVRYVVTSAGAANAGWIAANPAFRLVGPDDSFYRVYEYLRAKAPYGWVDAGGEAHPVEWLPERRVFRVQSAGGGRFYFGEELLPGWTAAIDGREAPVARWNRVFQSVHVAPGEHTIIFSYHAEGLLPGAAIGLAAAVGMAILVGRKPKAYCKPR